MIGAGHAHLYVASLAGELIKRGARVLLVGPGRFWYSGLATGMLGGMYAADDDQVDPRALTETCGGEFIADRVVSVDTERRIAYRAGGDNLTYDYLSINVGSRANLDTIPGLADDPNVWPVKPVSNLWRLRRHLESVFEAGSAPRVAEDGALITDNGQRIQADVVVPAIGLEANTLVHDTSLPADTRQGLRINARLYSIAEERVFAGG